MEHRSVLVVHERTTVHSPSLRRRDSADLTSPRTACHRPTASSLSSQPSPPPASGSGECAVPSPTSSSPSPRFVGVVDSRWRRSPGRSAGRVPRRPQTLGHRCIIAFEIIAFERGPGDPGSPGRAVELAPAGKRGVGVSAPARPAAPRRAVRGAREAASGRLRSGRGEPIQNRPRCWASAMLAGDRRRRLRARPPLEWRPSHGVRSGAYCRWSTPVGRVALDFSTSGTVAVSSNRR
jgi:hypothetical protein